MSEDGHYVDLVKIGDPIEADLLSAFLGDSEIEFEVVNRGTAGIMSNIMPASVNPIVFKVLEDDKERALELIEEYRMLQKASIPPDSDDDEDNDSEVDDSE
ncbi:MAG: DUF2007 domain-containing protein [Deltaproteobacteria bacterium]|nr:DUF2007 domain-containing protein [Deltaproteobacteria bacterium]